jgi:hypothetical protein
LDVFCVGERCPAVRTGSVVGMSFMIALEQLEVLLRGVGEIRSITHNRGFICRRSFGRFMWRLNWQQTMTMLSSRSLVDVCFSACMLIFG